MKKKSNPATDVVEDQSWRVESDLRTCIEYHKIKKDPKRFAAVLKLAGEQKKSLETLGNKE